MNSFSVVGKYSVNFALISVVSRLILVSFSKVIPFGLRRVSGVRLYSLMYVKVSCFVMY